MVGLYVPAELFQMNLRPPAILIAAEIIQFGPGKCHARTGHFETRFSLSKNTVLDAFKALREIKILAEDGPIKVINLENYCSEIAPDRSVSGPNRSEIDCSESESGCSEIAPKCSETEGSVQKLDRDLNIEDNKKKQELSKKGVSAERRLWNERRDSIFEDMWKDFPKKEAKETAHRHFMKVTEKLNDERTLAFFCLAIGKFISKMRTKAEADCRPDFVTRLSTFIIDKIWKDDEYQACWNDVDGLLLKRDFSGNLEPAC